MTIRRATITDAPALFSIAKRQAEASPFYSTLDIDDATLEENIVLDIANRTVWLYVNEVDGEVRAFIRVLLAYYYVGKQKFVIDVMLLPDPDHAGQGYAADLMKFTHAEAEKEGVHSIMFVDTLGVDTQGTTGLLTGLGYTEAGKFYRGTVADLPKS